MVAQQDPQRFELYMDAANANAGMDVYSRDGKKLGVVREVWAYIPPYGYVTKSSFALADYGPVRGTMHLFEGADGYLHIVPARGTRPDNDQDLYIPLSAVEDAITGQALVVGDRSDTCHAFVGRPEYLQERR